MPVEVAVGVPEIAQVLFASDKPAGSAGEDAHETIVPPVLVGVIVVIAVPLVKLKSAGLKLITGAAALTAIVIAVLEEPLALVPVIT